MLLMNQNFFSFRRWEERAKSKIVYSTFVYAPTYRRTTIAMNCSAKNKLCAVCWKTSFDYLYCAKKNIRPHLPLRLSFFICSVQCRSHTKEVVRRLTRWVLSDCAFIFFFHYCNTKLCTSNTFSFKHLFLLHFTILSHIDECRYHRKYIYYWYHQSCVPITQSLVASGFYGIRNNQLWSRNKCFHSNQKMPQIHKNIFVGN